MPSGARAGVRPPDDDVKKKFNRNNAKSVSKPERTAAAPDDNSHSPKMEPAGKSPAHPPVNQPSQSGKKCHH
jgi:hypothetical protein